MGDEERERRRTDEADVEAHYRPNKPAQDDGAKEPEDKSGDDAPDVEAHYRPVKP